MAVCLSDEREREEFARKVLSLIDLTSLNDGDGESTVERLISVSGEALEAAQLLDERKKECIMTTTASSELSQAEKSAVRTRHPCASPPSIAALCVWPRLLTHTRRQLDASALSSTDRAVRVCTVINFPKGQSPIDAVVEEAARSLDDGAEELDLVFPYKRLISLTPSCGEWLGGDSVELEECCRVVSQVRKLCDGRGYEATSGKGKPINLKVILETGELEGHEDNDAVEEGESNETLTVPQQQQKQKREIKEKERQDLAAWRVSLASMLVIAAGGRMLKTSTGKTSRGASAQSVRTMCEVITWCEAASDGGVLSHSERVMCAEGWEVKIVKDAMCHIQSEQPRVGIKLSGGVRTLEDAHALMAVVEGCRSSRWAWDKDNVRIGASSLVEDVIRNMRPHAA